ncbi:MAG: hypothetical protein ACE5MI_00460 [Acidimicrobiia bacterium]
MNEQLVVRRSALRVWLVALLAAPFWIFGADLIFQQRLVGRLGELIYPGDVPAFEARDSLWAWLFLIGGIAVTAWALKELLAPRRVIVGDHEELSLAISGPFGNRTHISWEKVVDVDADRALDDGDVLPVLRLQVSEPDLLPPRPWGARLTSPTSVVILASDWDTAPGEVAMRIDELRATYGDDR